MEQDTVRCIFCAATISVVGLSDVRYKDHFVKHHNIICFDTSKLVLITFQEQRPTLLQRNISWEQEDKETQTSFSTISRFTQYCADDFPPDDHSRGYDDFLLTEDRFLHQDRPNSSLSNGLPSTPSPDRKTNLEFRDGRDSVCSAESEGSSSKRSRSTSSEDTWRKKSKLEKTCEKCAAVFDQIFDFESHLVLCYNKVRSSVKPLSLNVADYSGSSYLENPVAATPSTRDTDSLFHCRICDKVVLYADQSSHLSDLHGLSGTMYSNLYEMEKERDPCLLCDKSVELDRSSLSEHLRNIHQMELDEYRTRFSLDGVKLSAKSKGSVECSQCQKRFCSKYSLKRHYKTHHSNDGQEDSVNENSCSLDEQLWYSRFGYECKKCNAQFSHKRSLLRHIEKIHKMNLEDFIQEFGELTTTGTFICGICSKKLRWTGETIRKHLDDKHCLSLENYGKIYMDSLEPDGSMDHLIRQQTKTTPVKPVAVNMRKLDKAIVTRLFQDSDEMLDNDYASLTKQDLGKRVNTAIENLFSFSPKKNPTFEENYSLDEGSTVQKYHRCSVCLYRTEIKEDLKNHTRALHTRIEPVLCCCSAFTTRWNLFLHLHAKHQQEDILNNQFSPAEISILGQCVKIRKNGNIPPNGQSTESFIEMFNEDKEMMKPCESRETDRHVVHDKVSVRFVGHCPMITDRLVKSRMSRREPAITYDRVDEIENLSDADHEASGDIDDLLSDFSSDLEYPTTPDDKGKKDLDVSIDIESKSLDDQLVFFNADDVDYEDNDVDDIVSPHVIWANRCVYSCQICHRFTVCDRANFMQHLKKMHGIATVRAYTADYGDLMTATKYVKCQMCGEDVMHDYTKLYWHLHRVHRRMTVNEYHEEYVVNLTSKKEEFRYRDHALSRLDENGRDTGRADSLTINADNADLDDNALSNSNDKVELGGSDSSDEVDQGGVFSDDMVDELGSDGEFDKGGAVSDDETDDCAFRSAADLYQRDDETYDSEAGSDVKVDQRDDDDDNEDCEAGNGVENDRSIDDEDHSEGGRNGEVRNETEISDEGSENEDERQVVEYKSWVNRSQIDCAHDDCTYNTKDVIEFRMHTLSVHSELFEQYCDTYGYQENDIWSEPYHMVCVLCLETIVHSHDSLDAHMVDCHDMSGFEYFIAYVKGNKRKFGSAVNSSSVKMTIEHVVPDEFDEDCS